MSSSLLQIGLGSLLESPAVAEFAAKAGEKAISVVQAYFTFSADEIGKAYQKSFENTLNAIRDELDQKRSLVSSKLRRDFSAQFAEPIKIAGKDIHSDALKIFIKHKDKLFQIEKITETDLAALINFQGTVVLTDFLLEQMQRIAPVDDNLAAFFRHEELLGKAMLFYLREQFRTEPRFEKTLAALQREAILFNQQLMLDLMNDLRLSSQVKASDEFTRHDTATRTVIQNSLANLKGLPTDMPEYSQFVLMMGSATSSTGDLEQSESLFSQVIENTHIDDEKALAYFNRFQVRLRRKAYDKALVDLEAAIAINPEQYALHDVKTFPMVQLLGAGGMGCVFLCRNLAPLIKNKDQVVVKCFWETLKGSPDEVFKEAVAMREIAGDYVPEPLDAGYANPFKQERAFFVTEYIEGTIDGEGWLEKYGTMDLKTGWQVALSLAEGLQVAHEKEIFHLDLKPANILLRDSPAAVPLKIIDFGLAQIAPTLQQEALTRQNQSGLSQFGQAVMGTLHYAAPEQQGYTEYGEPSAKSDVFAFGATMYRFWTGLIPRRYLERNLPNVPALRDLVLDCVEEEPNKRPYSAGEVLARFESIEETQRKIREDEKAWQNARGQDTKFAYEAYLRGNTLKKYADAAKNRLQTIEAKDFAPVVEDDFIVTEDSDWIETPVDSNDAVDETKRWLDDRAWGAACEQNTPFAYQGYLDGNTVKRHAVEAKKRIKALEIAAAERADETAWKNACQQNTEAAYQAYLEGKTLKRHAIEAQGRMDEKAWEKACQQNTEAAYQAYLEGKTLKKYAREAQGRMDEKAWEEACQQDTEAAYLAYLDGNTLKKYAIEVKPRLQAIEADEKAWALAVQQNTPFAYQAYLNGNTLKKYAQKAEECIDSLAWQEVCQQNTRAAYQDYLNDKRLKKYHVYKAKKCIDSLVWQEVCQQDTGAAYQAYLNGETLKKYAQKAKQQIKAIREREADNKAWENARQQDTETAYLRYLERYERLRYLERYERHATEAKQQLRMLLPSLSPLNPLDHLRLLWWILVMPQRLKAYRAIYGDKEQKRVGKWLVSTLIWLPLLMPTLALGL